MSVDGYRWVENAGRISTNVQRFAFAAAAIALLSGMVIVLEKNWASLKLISVVAHGPGIAETTPAWLRVWSG